LSDSEPLATELTDSDSSLDEDEFMDELDRYLLTGRIKDVMDPLSRWVENKGTYPRLLRIAQDYLTIPGEPSHTVTLYRVLADKTL
jgi:hAT family C-terminal dimerisation region